MSHPTRRGFMMAYEDDQLIGTFGVDADPEVNRAWLFGPLIAHTDWYTIADQLYASVVSLIPVHIRDYDLFCDVQNAHIDGFALKHGFPLTSENAVLLLSREAYRPSAKKETQVTTYQEQLFDQFEKLHNTLFPNTYLTARQIVEKRNKDHQLFFAVEGSNLLGYHFCKIEPESESGYVDFIGTDASTRQRGIGADLLASGLDWMLSAPATQKIRLTVNVDN